MTPKEKIFALQQELRNSLGSIKYIRDVVDPLMRSNPDYQRLIQVVGHFQQQAEQLLKDIRQEEKGEIE